MNYRNTYLIINEITRLVFPSAFSRKSIKIVIKLLYSLIKNNGTLHCVKTWKTMRLHITRYMCGKPLKVSPMLIGLTRDGFPKKLIFLKELIDSGNIQDCKFALTILGISRTIKPSSKEDIKVDYTSINKPYETKGMTIPIGFIRKFVNDFNLTIDKPKTTTDDIYLSLKSGPNGHATLSAGKSLLGHSYPQLQRLFNLAPGLMDFICNSYTYFWDNSDKFSKFFNKNKDKLTGRISVVKDPECKMRVIAIVDYYSQLVLRPIHKKLFSLLKRLPRDRTFTQDPRIENRVDNTSSY
jgi:hypothetical protein